MPKMSFMPTLNHQTYCYQKTTLWSSFVIWGSAVSRNLSVPQKPGAPSLVPWCTCPQKIYCAISIQIKNQMSGLFLLHCVNYTLWNPSGNCLEKMTRRTWCQKWDRNWNQTPSNVWGSTAQFTKPSREDSVMMLLKGPLLNNCSWISGILHENVLMFMGNLDYSSEEKNSSLKEPFLFNHCLSPFYILRCRYLRKITAMFSAHDS